MSRGIQLFIGNEPLEKDSDSVHTGFPKNLYNIFLKNEMTYH